MENNSRTKVCNKCGKELPVEHFSRSRKNAGNHLHKVYFNPELARFQPKDLIAELRDRGYSGELSIKQTIVV